MNTGINLIAETAWHHEGDINFMKSLVGSIVHKSKADIVKLHITLDLDRYISKDHPIYNKLKSWLLDKVVWEEIINLVRNNIKELMLLFNDVKAVEFGVQFEPALVEIHSTCLNDIEILDAVRNNIKKETKVVLGVGGSSLYEIEKTIDYLQHQGIVLMFGFQNFPTKYKDINFSKIRKIMKLFPEFQFGYADHTSWDEPNNTLITLFGAALGMNYIEKHVSTIPGKKRVDWSAAISIEKFNDLKDKINILEACNGDGLLGLNKSEINYSVFGPMKKAALLTRDVTKGDILTKELLCFKRTKQISDLSQINVLELIGARFTQNVKKGKVLKRSFFLE
jgi:N,N'-diacetyllegionaminate synthase